MRCDIISAGVGGQGVLSISGIIAHAALDAGLHVKQSEVHGMSQRGGAVITDLRLSDGPIHSDLIPRGTADLVVSMEPLEALRYLDRLSPSGVLLVSDEPVVNIPDYPDREELLERLRAIPAARVIAAGELAREAGSHRATNMVMVGAAADSLPIDAGILEERIRRAFESKGEEVVACNLEAFRSGRRVVEETRQPAGVGSDPA